MRFARGLLSKRTENALTPSPVTLDGKALCQGVRDQLDPENLGPW